MIRAVPGALFVDEGDHTLYLIIAAKRPHVSRAKPYMLVSDVMVLTSCGKLNGSIISTDEHITWLSNAL